MLNCCEIGLMWMPQNLTNEKSTSVRQLMAWCHQATSRYVRQSWPCHLSPCVVTSRHNEFHLTSGFFLQCGPGPALPITPAPVPGHWCQGPWCLVVWLPPPLRTWILAWRPMTSLRTRTMTWTLSSAAPIAPPGPVWMRAHAARACVARRASAGGGRRVVASAVPGVTALLPSPVRAGRRTRHPSLGAGSRAAKKGKARHCSAAYKAATNWPKDPQWTTHGRAIRWVSPAAILVNCRHWTPGCLLASTWSLGPYIEALVHSPRCPWCPWNLTTPAVRAAPVIQCPRRCPARPGPRGPGLYE